MTNSRGAEIRRTVARPISDRIKFADDLLSELQQELELLGRIKFPDPYFWEHPEEFFELILGVEPWSKQMEVIRAIVEYRRVAVKSGHKVSKSHTAAGMALLFYCSFDEARVVMSSTTSRQVDRILWRELRMMRAKAGRCLACKLVDPDGPRPCEHSALIDGDLGDLARSGMKSKDFREIYGFTADEAEAVAGISAPNLLYILDEASGIADEIFEAVEGNRAGGARIVLFSNPTKTDGEFFDAFHEKKNLYKCITISSEETPNVLSGERQIPGLAERWWIEEKKEEWGEDSPMYRVRIKGEFATREDGKIFSIHAIETSESRWEEASQAGRLFIGLDPAGETGRGDETVFALRRGQKILKLIAKRGLNDDGHLAVLLDIIETNKVPREVPVVVLDREGSIGSSLAGKMRAFVDGPSAPFELVTVRVSDRAHRRPEIYDRMRDELTANFEVWVREGGAIPPDSHLQDEMHALEWEQGVNGRMKVTKKTAIRKSLGRSPDRYDAAALSAWEPLYIREGASDASDVARAAAGDTPAFTGLDPYAGSDAWQRR